MLWPLLALLGCHPHVDVSFLQPADLTLPADLVDLSVVDRPASAESMVVAGSLKAELYESSRLTLVDEDRARAAARLVVLTRPAALSAADIGTLCKESGADGLAVIESARLSSSDETTVEEKEVEKNGVVRKVNVYTFTRTLRARADLTLTDCDGTQLDTFTSDLSDTLSATGRSEAEARGSLDPDEEAALGAELLAGLGARYAAHIVPTWASGRRAYFRSGHPDLTAGHQALQDDKLQRAEKLWRSVWDTSTDPKERGRAAFNLAVLAEVQADVPTALQWLRSARGQLGDRALVLDYRTTLRQRKATEQVVDQQLMTSP